MKTILENKEKDKHFKKRLDHYWKFIAIYAFALIIVALLRGRFTEGTYSLVLNDPIVILLAAFIIISFVTVVFDFYKNLTIIVGKDFLIFKSRFAEKKYLLSDIDHITIVKQRYKSLPNKLKIIKIRLKNRIRTLNIRPSAFWNEQELISSISRLKSLIQ
ncbi:MAG TPA: hypothetical protein PKY56_11900 [Candidatus Kapabacteria bacterium]|nr:hypothetical protein [Candidatus Kapabacteria bacterium]HPO63232.1 hypothetical protein [Candidatus Kapabacteria bacterium]